MSQPARASTPLSSLKVTTPSMVVSLSRNGIVSVHDVLTRPLDEVAYLLDSYDEAEALIVAAQEFLEGRGQDSGSKAPTPKPTPKEPRPENRAPAPVRPIARTPRRPRKEAGPRNPDMNQSTNPFADAISMVMAASGPVATSASEKAHRLTTAAIVLTCSGEEAMAIASVIVEPIHLEIEPMDRQQVRERFGDGAANLLDEVDALMSVPMTPSGRPSPAYKRTVEEASEGALVVAGAHALTAARAVTARSRTDGDEAWSVFQGGRSFAAWYFKTLAEGIGGSLRGMEYADLAAELSAAVDDVLEEAEGTAQGRKAA
ncbi:MAG: hypothetical protein ACF8R7_18980 [Phycisphaerales bacterium JB039]